MLTSVYSQFQRIFQEIVIVLCEYQPQDVLLVLLTHFLLGFAPFDSYCKV